MADNSVSTPELKLNLNAIKKCDQFVVNIIDTASQVALYKFNSETQAWEKTEVEGALFVYSRSKHPKNAFFIMNRLNMNNIMEPITSSMEFKLQDPFLLFTNKPSGIFGIWFYAGQECIRLSELLIRLSSEEIQSSKRPSSGPDLSIKEKPQAAVANDKVDIMQMFVKAQENYDKRRVDKSEPAPKEQKPSVEEQKQQFLQQNLQQTEQLQQLLKGSEQGRKQRAYSTSAAPSTLSTATSVVAYNPDNGPLGLLQALSDNKPSKGLPLSGGKAAEDSTVDNTARAKAQRKLFQSEKQTSLSASSPAGSQDTPQKGMEQAARAASLMSPMAFKAPPRTSLPNVNAIPKPASTPRLDISPLTQDQLIQAFSYLMKNDNEFVRKLHEAYLKSLQERLPT